MSRISLFTSPYQTVNILTGIVIITVFIYSGLFGTGYYDYPVECAHVSLYGEDCPTCGLSRSFSEMIRGNIDESLRYNKNGPLIFIFFASQLILRTIAGILLFHWVRIKGNQYLKATRSGIKRSREPGSSKTAKKINAMVLSDAVISIALFLFCFRNLLFFWQ